MKISIVTVCFNSEATIEDTILSVLSQTYENIEYIVVDGGSKDATLNIIEKHRDKITKVISEPDDGIYDAMNKGISLCTGDVIGILNSDDVFASDTVVDSIAKQFINDSSISILYGDICIVDRHDLSKTLRRYSLPRLYNWKLRIGLMPPHPSTFVRTGLYEDFGVYKTDYKIAADFEFFVRTVLRHKKQPSYMPETITLMRHGGVSSAGFRSVMISTDEMVRALKDNGYFSNRFICSLRLPIKLFSKLIGTNL